MIREFSDQTAAKVSIQQAPARIVSLVPSQTELLFSLGLGEQVVGITRFCRHPETQVGEKIKVGGTKDFDVDKVIALRPDLVLANKEENEREGIEALRKTVPVWTSDVKDLASAMEMLLQVGIITERAAEATALRATIEATFLRFVPVREIRTAYFIWRKPYMTAGRDTFIRDMMQRCGMANVFDNFTRYPVLDAQQLRTAAPELILLSSEPYPFKEHHVAEFQDIFPDARIVLVDGEMFSWYGSRLLHAIAYFKSLTSQIL